ncbi:hypothetical protein OPV22_013046 [Ensete ventricosum]|uniref:Proteasome alpha-type subunits domain-containing protein n=1 Tax=Ensete ventricosum TaxID=4639 RepID=A0AAV8QYH0_ENSVE|nr:hypothetical protein OPV22_013046 [Ensete ventricosum]
MERLFLFHLSFPPVLGFTLAALPLGLRWSPQETLRTRTEYDRGVNTFSAEGSLFQVEYAIKLGSTAIALKTKEGVVLAVDTFWQCNAKAIGSGSEGTDSSLQKQYNKDLTLQLA